MRPERLEMEGFTAFRRRTVVDFTDADLFALSGPTGAGKSSVIDAIVFALYGTVPRLADRRRVGAVISQGLVEARLGFDFSIGPRRYRVVRVVRATSSGSASTKEARLEQRLPDGTTALLAGDADEVSRTVGALLGLSYEHFTTAVVLPQGEFARFLHHKAADRQALLKELLDLGLYDRLQRRAGQCAKLEAHRAELARARLDELVDANDEAAAQLDEQQASVGALLDACDRARPTLDQLSEQFAAAQLASEHARRTAELLRAVEKPRDVVALANTHNTLVAALADAEENDEPHRAAVEQAESALASLPTVADSERVIEAHAQLDQQREQISQGLEAQQAQHQRLAQAVAASQAAAAVLVAADLALEAARTASAAAALAEHLHPGDDCPVCGQVVNTLPAALPNGLGNTVEAQRQATADAAKREAERQKHETELTRIETRLEQRTAESDVLAQRIAAGADLKTAERNLAAVRAATEALAATRAARDLHTSHFRQARDAVQQSTQLQQKAWASFDQTRDQLAALGPPAAARTDLDVDWDQLVAWALEQSARLGDRAASDDADATELTASRERALNDLRAQAEHVLAGRRGTDFGEIRDLAVADQARLATRRQQLTADLARAQTARIEHKAATEDERVASTVAQLLRADRFGAWIVDEALQQLVQSATGLLHSLSSGAYSMVMDGKDFAVIDHNNADTMRSARTLSGGETFLASLALALALAEQVMTLAGPTAAPLESLFLDEGFGSLDPDTLDAVATAIEELGSSGRMVGLVTHVRDLAERLPVRFEVTKGPNGATVERVMA